MDKIITEECDSCGSSDHMEVIDNTYWDFLVCRRCNTAHCYPPERILEILQEQKRRGIMDKKYEKMFKNMEEWYSPESRGKREKE